MRKSCVPWGGLFFFRITFALYFSGALRATDWPQLLGPSRDGTSDEKGLIERIPSEGVPILWEKAIGKGYAAPSIRDGRLVYFNREGDEEAVVAVDAKTGARIWRHAYPSRYTDPYGYNNGPRCAPLISSNRVYTFGAEGRLTCLDFATGAVRWKRDTASEFQVPEAFFGVGSTPLLEGGRLIVMVGGQPDSGVVAFDPESGSPLWQSVGKSCWDGVVAIGWRGDRVYQWRGVEKLASYSSPIAATIQGRRTLLCVMRQGLAALDPTNGAVKFVRWFQSEVNDSVNAMTPVVHSDDVLISAAYYRIGSVLLHVNADGSSFQEVWRQPQSPFERNLVTGRPVEPILGMHWSQPQYVDGYLYGFTGRNEPDAFLRCVEWKTGKLMWERDESWLPHSTAHPSVMGRGSFIQADGKLIALGEGGILAIIKPNPAQCEEMGRWQVPSLGHPCWAAPVLCDKRLYLRGEDRLVCLDFGKKP